MVESKRKNRLPGAGKVTAFALAALLFLPGVRQPVLATEPLSADTDGKTTSEVNLGVSERTVATVDFEVPLYYTMCVCTDDEGKTTVALPDKSIYTIKSGTKGGVRVDGKGTEIKVDERRNQTKIAVTALQISRIENSTTWDLVTTEQPTGSQRQMYLKIGEVAMPAINRGSTSAKVDLTTSKNTFYDPNLNGQGSGGYVAIKGLAPTKEQDPQDEAETYTAVPVEARVSPDYTFTESIAATAQFKVVYTISPIDDQGQIIKAGYDKQVSYQGPGNTTGMPEDNLNQTWDIDKDGNKQTPQA